MQAQTPEQESPVGDFPVEGSPYTKHVPALDGVRAFAVLGVMASHLFPATSYTGPERFIRSALGAGAFGVDLFFVLSGFLITGILFDSLADTHYFRKFYARRALRIFPLYYGVLALFVIIGLAHHHGYHHELASLAVYLQNTYLIAPPINGYIGPPPLPLSHFWSLAIEEQFYIVWPLLLFLLRKRRRALVFSLAAILVCPLLRFVLATHGFAMDDLHTNTLCRADSLLAGGALALALRSDAHGRILRAARWLIPIGILGFAMLSLCPSTIAWTLHYSCLALIFVGVLAAALVASPFARFASTPVLRWIGKYSYGLYVYHLILFGVLQHSLKPLFPSASAADKLLAVLATGLLTAALSAVVAYLSFQLYERRFLRLKRFFDYRPHGQTGAGGFHA